LAHPSGQETGGATYCSKSELRLYCDYSSNSSAQQIVIRIRSEDVETRLLAALTAYRHFSPPAIFGSEASDSPVQSGLHVRWHVSRQSSARCRNQENALEGGQCETWPRTINVATTKSNFLLEFVNLSGTVSDGVGNLVER
jgi:hypothetical protein